jgi:uncharacterized protein (DUF1499 family)
MTRIEWTPCLGEVPPRKLWNVSSRSFPRAQIVTRTDDYLHIEFRSLIFRFIDDVEFWVNPAEEVIHFRSASRIGYSDLGANRKRMNAFVSRFNELNGGAP